MTEILSLGKLLKTLSLISTLIPHSTSSSLSHMETFLCFHLRYLRIALEWKIISRTLPANLVGFEEDFWDALLLTFHLCLYALPPTNCCKVDHTLSLNSRRHPTLGHQIISGNHYACQEPMSNHCDFLYGKRKSLLSNMLIVNQKDRWVSKTELKVVRL